MGKVCPRCGKAIPRGALHHCPLASKPTRNAAREREKRSRETWRDSYNREYRDARKTVIRASNGLCEACGAPVFTCTRRGWKKVARDFGGTHHLVPLSRGGTNDPENVAVLCARCHAIAHTRAFGESATEQGIISKSWALRFIRDRARA